MSNSILEDVEKIESTKRLILCNHAFSCLHAFADVQNLAQARAIYDAFPTRADETFDVITYSADGNGEPQLINYLPSLHKGYRAMLIAYDGQSRAWRTLTKATTKDTVVEAMDSLYCQLNQTIACTICRLVSQRLQSRLLMNSAVYKN
jgi:hypothetical protein